MLPPSPPWLQVRLWPGLTQHRCCSWTLFLGAPGRRAVLAREADVTVSLATGTSSPQYLGHKSLKVTTVASKCFSPALVPVVLTRITLFMPRFAVSPCL